MLKKFGLIATIAGVFCLVFGFWMLESGGNYGRYSSEMRTIMELAPWFFTILGAFGIMCGIFYITQERKPLNKALVKVIEKNGMSVVLELEDGSRKTLTILGNVPLIVGDKGIVGYKGSFITEFKKEGTL